jgi:hypothetical protein
MERNPSRGQRDLAAIAFLVITLGLAAVELWRLAAHF